VQQLMAFTEYAQPMQIILLVAGILLGGALGLRIVNFGVRMYEEKHHPAISSFGMIVALAVAGVFYLLSTNFAGSFIYIVNHLDKPVIVTIGDQKPLTVKKNGFESILVPSGQTKIVAKTDSGKEVEAFSETLDPRLHYMYKVKGKGDTALFDITQAYTKKGSKAGVRFSMKRVEGKFKKLGDFSDPNKVIIPGRKKMPKEITGDTQVFVFRDAAQRSDAKFKKLIRVDLSVVANPHSNAPRGY
jgi:hypothetical protein